ncbi:MAG: nucleotidyltransferase domain-containing protein [Actinomycetota bacterium]|nr:nucleotidyltransferase domain-containing protein [Actinomycetota bacterium]
MDILSIQKSKLREDLLTLYFTNTEKKYYLRELERMLKHSVANIRRELLRLEEAGLFLREDRGNQVYYYLNKSFPLFDELKSIIFKTSGVTQLLRNALASLKDKDIGYAFIYGSFAKKEEREDSNIDLLIIGEVNEDEMIKKINKLEKRLQREINYSIYSKE